jgi:PEP-CTERM motif
MVTDVTMPLRIESAGVIGHFSVSIYDATGAAGMPGQSTGSVVAYYDASLLTRSVLPISWHNLSIVLSPDTDYYLVAKGIDLSGATVSSVGWGETADATGIGFPSNRFNSSGSNWVIADEYTVQYPFNMKIEGTAAVPEPSTYALFCIGLGMFGYARKRMNKE